MELTVLNIQVSLSLVKYKRINYFLYKVEIERPPRIKCILLLRPAAS